MDGFHYPYLIFIYVIMRVDSGMYLGEGLVKDYKQARRFRSKQEALDYMNDNHPFFENSIDWTIREFFNTIN